LKPTAELKGKNDDGLQAISPVAEFLGAIPNRLQLAGGWIDQPFVSECNPSPPGSMVVVQIQPDFRPMERSGIVSNEPVPGAFHVNVRLAQK
jgi:hypothetical protein